MKQICRRLQNTLADQGPAALRDDQAAQHHLEECEECFGMLEALAAIDAGFDAMPPMDAPDELVESLLERVAPLQGGDHLRGEATTRSAWRSWVEAAKNGARSLFGPGQPRLKAAVAFALLAAISPVFYLQVMSRKSAERMGQNSVVATPPPETSAAAGERTAQDAVASTRRRGLFAGAGKGLADERPNLPSVEPANDPEPQKLEALGYLTDAPDQIVGGQVVGGMRETLKELETPTEGTFVESLDFPTPQIDTARDDSNSDIVFPSPVVHQGVVRGAAPTATERAPENAKGRAAGAGAKDDQTLDRDQAGEDSNLPTWVGTETNITFRGGSPRIESDASGPFDDDTDARQKVRDRLRARLQSVPGGLQDAEKKQAGKGEGAPDDAKGEKGAFLKADEHIEQLTVTAETPAVDPPRELARQFLAERDDVAAASRPATGYWSNTYVPGDPVLRYLQARLAGRDRAVLAPTATSDEPPRLHDGAHRTTQPFDPPTDAALAIQLQADRSATLGETRLLVQVGLAGTPRRSGRRPAMNVAVVLDLRGKVPAGAGPSMVSLAAAFGEAQDLGDRFRLIAAGRGGGEIVAPEDLRRGSAVVATSSLLAGDAPAGEAELGLVEAVRLAIQAVAGGDDPTAPLGSSAIVVATSRSLGADTATLAGLAHESAVAGIPLSVVGVGDGVDLAELDNLALAGQGSRRLLRDAAEARGLVDRELTAAGRAVARAVRLRLSLAPGVRLIDIVGAHRYDEAGAKQVRRAERAIDQRLARNLGLEADRGDDEAGIQIVIPTFYAGDHHAILLDVVVPGPGPIADVTVRFKDLVQLDNAVARARLDLPRGAGGRGPLERNVLKNLLAHRLRDVLDRAGQTVARGDRGLAVKLLSEHRRLLAGLQRSITGAASDRDLDRDVAMLDEYAQVLGGQWLEHPERRSYLADSLRYAARLKVLPAPMPVGGAR